MEQLKITYKIYLEADDISQSRIQASTAFVKNQLQGSHNAYLKTASIDDGSDLDEFMLRLFIENEVVENGGMENGNAESVNMENAESFVLDMAEFLDAVASAHSFMDMEGSFSWEYKGEKKSYSVRSESGSGYCDFEET